MRILSATEAISPAWEHTHSLLVKPRNWRIWLKVGLVAFFAQASGCNSRYSSSHGGHSHPMSPGFVGMMIAVALLVGFVALVISLVMFYVSSRLQFVFFDVVLRRDTTIGPIWNRFGRATWYWMMLKFLFAILALACLAPFLIPPILVFIRTIPAMAGGKTPDLHQILTLILSMLIPIFAAVFVLGLGYRLLFDFGLPSMALEGTPLGETVSRIFRFVRAEPAQVILYLLMHFVLSLGLGIASLLIMGLTFVIALIPLGGAGAALWFGLRHAGIGGYLVIGLGAAVLGIIMLIVVVSTILVLTAWTHTFLQAYALYFLGGRYPLLGEYLEPTPPLPPVPEPVWPTTPIIPPPPLPIEGEP